RWPIRRSTARPDPRSPTPRPGSRNSSGTSTRLTRAGKRSRPLPRRRRPSLGEMVPPGSDPGCDTAAARSALRRAWRRLIALTGDERGYEASEAGREQGKQAMAGREAGVFNGWQVAAGRRVDLDHPFPDLVNQPELSRHSVQACPQGYVVEIDDDRR